MDKSIVTKEADHISMNLRPNGFMLIQIMHRPGSKFFNYCGCIELRVKNHSTSFFYNVFSLNHITREYQFSLFTDKERYCCIFSAIVKYIDDSLITLQFEVIETAGLWAKFEEETVKLFHIMAYDGVIEGRRPRKDDGTYYDIWLSLYGSQMRKALEDHTFTNLRDIITRTNDLLSL